jgi:hypothetical protein
MNVFTQMTQRTVRKRALALMFVLAVALAGIAVLVASAMPAFAQGGGGGGCGVGACVSAGGGPNNPGGTGTGGGGGVEAYTRGGTTFAGGTAYPPAGACAGVEHESYRSHGGQGSSVDTFQCSFE